MLFGIYELSVNPFSTTKEDDDFSESSLFQQLLRDPDARRVFLFLGSPFATAETEDQEQIEQTGNGLSVSSVGTPPAMAALTSSRIAFIDSVNRDLRAYDFDGTDWSQTGNDFSISGVTNPTLARLTSSRVAFIDDGNDELKTLEFDGTDWSQVGNALSISGVITPAIAFLTSTRIALIDAGNGELRTYEFDGTDWSQVGTSLSISGLSIPELTGLTSTRVAYIDSSNDELRTFDFESGNWSQTGNSLSISGVDAPALATLTSSKICFIDRGNEQFRIFSFDGDDWTQDDPTLTVSGIGAPTLGALSSKRVAFIDSALDELRAYSIVTNEVTVTEAGVTTVNFMSGSKSEHVFDSTFWQSRLDVAINSQVELFSTQDRFGGGSVPGFGDITIAFGDGENDVLTDYEWDGRDIEVLMGKETFSFDEFGTVFKGTAQEANWDERAFSVAVRDFTSILDIPIQTNLYEGTGDDEGGDDIKGSPKPLCYGNPQNIEPILVDAAFNIYQVHDGAVEEITTVYDEGIAKDSEGDISEDSVLADLRDWDTTSNPDKFKTDHANGLFRLGALPSGIVTADVKGDNAGEDGFVQTTADIVKRIAKDRGSLTDTDLELQSFATLNTRQPANISIFIARESPTVADVIDRIMTAMFGYWTWTRERELVVGQIRIPSPLLTIDETDIISIQRTTTEIPSFRRRIGYNRAWRTMSEDELAGGVTEARRTLVTNRFRFETAVDTSIRTRRVLARDITIESLFDSQSDASTEASRQLTLMGADRHNYNITARGIQFRLRVGQAITVDHPRFGLSGGRTFLILGVSEDSSTGLTDLRLWG